jgi:hypothetical protein
MDIKQLEKLLSDVKLDDINTDDMSKLLKNIKNNKAQFNPNDINNLFASLTNNINPTEKEIKDVKDMTESEKIAHRNELKNKLKNKQNLLKQSRTRKNIIKNKLQESEPTLTPESIPESEPEPEPEQTIEDYLL